MAQQNRTTLKSYFNTGDVPSESNFSDFIDSSQIITVTDTVPANGALPNGQFVVVVNSTVGRELYVGDASNNPVPACGYRQMIGYLSQSSTNAPTVTIVKNTFGETPSFSRVNPGEYVLTMPSVVFTLNKTQTNQPYIDLAEQQFEFFWLSPNGSGATTMGFRTVDVSAYPVNPESDGYLSNTPFQIRLYV